MEFYADINYIGNKNKKKNIGNLKVLIPPEIAKGRDGNFLARIGLFGRCNHFYLDKIIKWCVQFPSGGMQEEHTLRLRLVCWRRFL
ncbi:MAG: hypothetical protein H0S79_12960 [Anaerolineaceae bacterium]|nr:hypothetical protein [Anaerolineaceae bacterium]